MKKLIVIIAGLALASAAAAQVDPTRPMLTGRGNVNARPVNLIVTNETPANAPIATTTTTTTTTAKSDDTVEMSRFQVTGSLLPHGK